MQRIHPKIRPIRHPTPLIEPIRRRQLDVSRPPIRLARSLQVFNPVGSVLRREGIRGGERDLHFEEEGMQIEGTDISIRMRGVEACDEAREMGIPIVDLGFDEVAFDVRVRGALVGALSGPARHDFHGGRVE